MPQFLANMMPWLNYSKGGSVVIGRQSVFFVTPEHERQVGELLDQLEASAAALPGYVMGFRYRATTNPGEFGRISVWHSQDDANTAAQNQHIMALRSQVMNIARIHEELDEHVLDIHGSISINVESEGINRISETQ